MYKVIKYFPCKFHPLNDKSVKFQTVYNSLIKMLYKVTKQKIYIIKISFSPEKLFNVFVHLLSFHKHYM